MIFWVSWSSSACPAICAASISLRSSASVLPRMRALRKLPASTKADIGTPAGTLSTRFSTWPSSATKTASARSGSSRTNSICLSRTFACAVSTTPAERVKPDKVCEASVSTVSSDLPLPVPATWASIERRSLSVRSPICISASTKKRRPSSVGSRPAEVCGAKIRPSCSRSDITLRTEAGDSVIGSRRARLREPTGSPVAR